MPSPFLALFTGRGSRSAVQVVTPARTFDDVILPPSTRETLDQAMAQVRNHALIFCESGLGEPHATGLGLVFSFAFLQRLRLREIARVRRRGKTRPLHGDPRRGPPQPSLPAIRRTLLARAPTIHLRCPAWNGRLPYRPPA